MTEENDRFTSRKFILASSSLTVGSIGLLLGVLDGSQYVALVGVVLALYGSTNVWEKKA